LREIETYFSTALTFLQKYLDGMRPELAKEVLAVDRERVFRRKKGALATAIIWEELLRKWGKLVTMKGAKDE
jgi:hypothetical protein